MVVAVYHYLFFFNDTATTEIYTLSLHDALPICKVLRQRAAHVVVVKVVDDHRPFDPCAVRDVIGSEDIGALEAPHRDLERRVQQARPARSGGDDHVRVAQAQDVLRRQAIAAVDVDVRQPLQLTPPPVEDAPPA